MPIFLVSHGKKTKINDTWLCLTLELYTKKPADVNSFFDDIISF